MINAEYFRLAHKFVALNNVTPSLRGVLIEPCAKGGVLIIGTNRQVISVFWDPIGFTPIARCIRVDGDLPFEGYDAGSVVSFNAGMASITDGSGESGFNQPYTEMDAFAYPEWRKAMKVEKGNRCAPDLTFDAHLMKYFNFKEGEDGIAVWAGSKSKWNDAHWVTHELYPTFIGAIMPRRAEADHMFGRPAWLD